jgi:hypothetical protein
MRKNVVTPMATVRMPSIMKIQAQPIADHQMSSMGDFFKLGNRPFKPFIPRILAIPAANSPEKAPDIAAAQ